MTNNRNRFRMLLLSGVLVIGYACTDVNTGDEGGDAERMAVVFVPQIEGNFSTRAVDTQWSEGDRVGVYMVDAGKTLPDGSTFSQYRVSGAGQSVNLIPVNTKQTLFYPINASDAVNFVAFSPYTTVTDNEVTYTGFADQSDEKKVETFNFLYHKGTEPYNRKNTSVALPFSHKLSKLIIKATTVTNISEAVTLSSLTMKISGTPGSVTANLADGSLTAGDAEDITPLYSDEDDNDTRTVKAIIVPHAGIPDRKITFSTIEGNHDFILPSDDAFEPGYMYTLEFCVTRQGVVLSAASNQHWADDNVTWNKDYVLSVPEENVTIPARKGKNTVRFKTNYSGTVSVKFSTSAEEADAGMPEWITPASPLLTVQGEEHICSFTTEAGEGIARTFYVHVTTGALSKVIQVTQSAFDPVANSYILAPGETVYIPVSRANDHGRETIGESDILNPDVLWMDTQGLLTTLEPFGIGADGAIKVTAASGKVGNAVITVKIRTDEVNIRWSWHIWVTDYMPDATRNNGWMDRNLGATSATKSATMPNRVKTFGLYYQWGRKDPFPGSVSDETANGTEPKIYKSLMDNTGTIYSTNQKVSTPRTISWTVANPDKFITLRSVSWMSGSSAEDRNWNGIGDTKTIYDPCPAGWRVPLSGSWGSSSVWSDWNSNYKGHDAVSHGGWYPAVGYRLNLDGKFDAVGTTGYYWSASPYDAVAGHCLALLKGSVYPINSSDRSHGYAVRCVAE